MKSELDRFRTKNGLETSLSNVFDSLYSNVLGFDPEFESKFSRSAASSNTAYPPYDTIQDSENDFRVIVAAAGFSQDEISVVVEKNQLMINGEKKKEKSIEDRIKDVENQTDQLSLYPKYLHRGIAMRKFSRSFVLGENVKVSSATFENGLLTVYLVREVPEEQKPKKIEIFVPKTNFLTSDSE